MVLESRKRKLTPNRQKRFHCSPSIRQSEARLTARFVITVLGLNGEGCSLALMLGNPNSSLPLRTMNTCAKNVSTTDLARCVDTSRLQTHIARDSPEAVLLGIQ